MTYTERYITSFGKLTSKEIEIVKRSFGYQRYLFADALIDVKREIWEALKGIIK